MMEHEKWFTHGYQVYEEIVRVPLLLRGPGLESARSSMPTSSIDVVPTILAFLGLESRGEGLDLRFPAQIDPERTVFAEASLARQQWRMVVRQGRKWLVAIDPSNRSIVAQKLFDLNLDPNEKLGTSITKEDPLAAILLERIRMDPDPGGIPHEVQRGLTLSAPKVAPDVTEEQLQRLKALGYAE
jgi:arylsulfatase A-like enzyme